MAFGAYLNIEGCRSMQSNFNHTGMPPLNWPQFVSKSELWATTDVLHIIRNQINFSFSSYYKQCAN